MTAVTPPIGPHHNPLDKQHQAGLQWLKANMPPWMQQNNIDPNGMLQYIKQNPNSPIAQMFGRAGFSIGQHGGIQQGRPQPGGAPPPAHPPTPGGAPPPGGGTGAQQPGGNTPAGPSSNPNAPGGAPPAGPGQPGYDPYAPPTAGTHLFGAANRGGNEYSGMGIANGSGGSSLSPTGTPPPSAPPPGAPPPGAPTGTRPPGTPPPAPTPPTGTRPPGGGASPPTGTPTGTRPGLTPIIGDRNNPQPPPHPPIPQPPAPGQPVITSPVKRQLHPPNGIG